MSLIAQRSEYLWAGLSGPVKRRQQEKQVSNEKRTKKKLLRDELRGMPNDIGGRTNI
jgi:hypothetical protein